MSGRSATEKGAPSRAIQVATTSPGEMVKIPGGAEPKRGLRVSVEQSEPLYAQKLRESVKLCESGCEGAAYDVTAFAGFFQ